MDRQTLTRARRHLRRRDPVLAALMREVGPFQWGGSDTDLFSGLVTSIVSQQLSLKAASTILGRVRGLLPGGRVLPDTLRLVPHASLRAAGLSTRKAEFVVDLAARVDEGHLRLDTLRRLSDDEVVRELTAVRGIGRWTAEMTLMFRLARPDVLPLDDVGLLRAVQKVYGLRRRPTPKQFTKIAEPWRPWRTVACYYLWAALDQGSDR